MRPATQVVRIKPPRSNANDKAISHIGTPNGTRTNMAIGEVNGIILNQNASGPCGSLTNTPNDRMYVNSNGIVMGSINCCVSVSLSTADPTAANKALYSR